MFISFVRNTVIILLFLSSSMLVAQSSDWVYKGEKDGVKVYLQNHNGVYDVKLTTSLNTSLSAFCHLMADVESYPKWGYKVMETKVISQQDDQNMQYYSRLDFPWPLSDRDLTMQNTMSQDDHRVISFKSYSVAGLLPDVKDVIRLSDVKTSWTLYPPKNGWCYLEYVIHSDPKGSIPEWAVNAAIDMGPRETISAIKRELKKPKYKTISLAFIKD
jgi:ribosome-associated toxin RatA of RatAB toxin-antitoxin module